MIFLEQLKIFLLTGKIFLNSMGFVWKKSAGESSALFKSHEDADKYGKPDVSIFRALNKYWTQRAKHLLYGCNVFVLPPTGLVHDLMELFELWDLCAQKLVKSVEVRLSMRDFIDIVEIPLLFPIWRKWILSMWTKTFIGLRNLQLHHLLIGCRALVPENIFFLADKLNFSKILGIVTPAVIQIIADCPEHEERLTRRIRMGARFHNSYLIVDGSTKNCAV